MTRSADATDGASGDNRHVTTAAQATQGRTTGRVGALDGLRGVAVLGVTWCHLALHYGLTPRAPGGFIGVVVFFVLSGYLITGIVWRGASFPTGYGTFIRRRATRLGPAIAGMCAVYLVVMPSLGDRELVSTLRYAGLALVQGTGWDYSSEQSQVPPEFAPTWSLTVEWTFYVLWPLVLLVLRAWRLDPRGVLRLAVAAAVVLAGLGLLLPDRALYVLPVANLSVMLLGAALALSEVDRSSRGRPPVQVDPGFALLALLAIVTLSVIPGYPMGPAYRYAVMPATTGFTLLVIASIRDQGSIVRRMLGAPVLRAVGERAYSLYLWQGGVFWLVWRLLSSDRQFVAAMAAVLVLSVTVELSFRLLEKPVLHQP